MIETYRGTVFRNQEDHMGHMNVMWYISKYDEATWQFVASFGLTAAYVKEKNQAMVAVEQNVKYMAEVMAGTLLVVRSELLEVKNKVIRFRHTMFNAEDDSLVSTCELTAVYMDLGLRKSYPIPDFMQVNLQDLLAQK
jgi:acyl-CoA thioester hydrolase